MGCLDEKERKIIYAKDILKLMAENWANAQNQGGGWPELTSGIRTHRRVMTQKETLKGFRGLLYDRPCFLFVIHFCLLF